MKLELQYGNQPRLRFGNKKTSSVLQYEIVTLGIDKDRNLIIQFPVFIQSYTQKPLILYQIETLPIPIIDQNKQAHSYTHL